MTRQNWIFRKLYGLTGQKSGIVVSAESGKAVVCDWTQKVDLPHIFGTGNIEFGERLFLRKVRYVDDVAKEIDVRHIIYDTNGDREKLSGTSATAHLITTYESGADVCVVYTPQGWN